MADKYKASDYVKIVKNIIPEIEYASCGIDLGNIHEFPSLKNIVFLGKQKVEGMINFDELKSIYTS